MRMLHMLEWNYFSPQNLIRAQAVVSSNIQSQLEHFSNNYIEYLGWSWFNWFFGDN